MEWKHILKDEVSEHVKDRLLELIEKGPVTWFLSGGSNIDLQIATLKSLVKHPNIERLRVLLIDERFGPVGHADSNWQQLTERGFIMNGPTYIAPFTANETTLEQAVSRYESVLNDIARDGSYLFAQLGMGADGHTSGILPGSPSTSATDTYATGYDTEQYQRLTTTFTFLKRLDEAVLVAYGEDKWPQLARLSNQVDNAAQPIQILKDMTRVTIYTDYSNE